MVGFRNLVGGEITEYTRLMTETRAKASQRMVGETEGMGANAILGVRFTSSTVIADDAELLAYATAVVVEEAPRQ